MKICFLADGKSPHTIRWIRYFVNVGHDVSLITMTPPTKALKKITVYKLVKGQKFKFITYKRRIKELKKLLEEIKPDIVHAHYMITYGFMAVLTGFKPLISTAWGSDVLIAPNNSKIMKIRAKKALAGADLYHCDGIKTKIAMEKLGVPTDKIKIIGFGINQKNDSNSQIRKQYDWIDNPIIISLRSLNPLYNVESLIKAIPLILDKQPTARFLIVGGGSEEQMLKELANSLGIEKEIIFTGKIPFETISDYLTASDIYVSTSLSDAGLAASTGEAMAHSLPVIVTEDLDNRDWITDGINGFIVPIKSPEQIAEKTILLLQDKDLRKRMGEKNKALIFQRNDYTTEMAKMDAIYKILVAKNNQ